LIVSGLFIKPELQAQKNAKKTREIVQNYPDEQLQENSQKKTSGLLRWGLFSGFEGIVIHYVSLLRIESRSK